MDRREFMKGAALGVGAGVLGSMGLYSYSPLRRAFLPEVKRGTADIGVCKSVKVTNISETSWFDNGIFMNDVTGAGGLLVDQYTFNWAPFGNGKGVGKGTFEEGLKRIKHLLPHKIDLPRRDREHGRRDNPLPVRYREELRLDGHVLQARGHRRHACRQQDRRLHPDP